MGDLATLLVAVREGTPYRNLMRLLRASAPAAAARGAYAHPNGFLVFDLAEEGNEDLRLHVWDGTVEGQRAHAIHDHVYSAESVVIRGAIRQTTWSALIEGKTGEGELVEYAADYSQGGSALVPTGKRVDVVPCAVHVFREADRYELAAGVFHSVEVMELPSATLFLRRGLGGDARPKVLGAQADDGPCSLRVPVGPDRSAQALKAILDGL